MSRPPRRPAASTAGRGRGGRSPTWSGSQPRPATSRPDGNRSASPRPAAASRPAPPCPAPSADARPATPCAGGYPRCDVDAGGDGWRYRCGGKHAAAAGEGEGSEDLAEALEDLLIATDPSTIAGSQLPGDLADAIEGERQAFAALWNGWAGDQPPGEQLLAAARDVHAAALDLEADWTPELRAALTAVIEATGTGEQ
ncbi:MAG TPA: hypothetical protein VK586_12510 [Streptosporangiaceae bacterium]|nr:hypothetical protein [Streptosporangiaceae bacterium]